MSTCYGVVTRTLLRLSLRESSSLCSSGKLIALRQAHLLARAHLPTLMRICRRREKRGRVSLRTSLKVAFTGYSGCFKLPQNAG